MANRSLYQFRYAYEINPVDVFAKVNIGSTGAPTLVANQAKGIKSIVRNSAGRYTVTFTDNFARIMMQESKFIVASGTPAAPSTYLVSDGVSSATPTAVIQCLNGTTATDPASGEVLMMNFVMKNSSV